MALLKKITRVLKLAAIRDEIIAKNLFLMLILLSGFIFIAAGCSDDKDLLQGGKNPQNHLLSGSWMFAAFVDVESGTSRPPSDDDGTTLTMNISFAVDSAIISGNSRNNQLRGYYVIDYNKDFIYNLPEFNVWTITEVNEWGDSQLFLEEINKVHGYIVAESIPMQLNLFYNDGKNILRFVENLFE